MEGAMMPQIYTAAFLAAGAWYAICRRATN